MKNTEVMLGLAALCAVGCNARSPETTEQHAKQEVSESTQQPIEEAPAKVVEAPRLPELAGTYLVAVDLLDNRPNAHRVEFIDGQPTVLVDAAAEDFVRYIHGNHPNDWKLNAKVDEVSAALLTKKRTGSMWIPGYPDAASVQAKVWSGANNNALTFHINHTKLEPIKLEKGWQIVSIDTDKLGAENDIEFDFSNMARVDGNLTGGAVAWVRVGRSADRAPANEVSAGQGSWTLTSHDGAAFMLWGLDHAALAFDIKAKPSCGFKVTADVEDGKGGTQEAFSQIVTALEGPQVQSSFVPLDAIKGQIARVTFKATEGCDVEFSKLALKIPGEPVEIPKVAAPEHVVFWMIDTLRADHTPIHFTTNVRAPNLKRLAEEGASFKLAYVEGNESKTSHASLFSGMLPNKHRVIGRGKLKPELLLMPEAVKAAGYKTAAFIANGYVSEPWGFVQGWDTYRNHLRDNYRIDGPSMAQAGIDWAAKNLDAPFFLYIGTVDPHVTYREHEDIIGHYDTEPYDGRFKKACYGEDLGQIKGGAIKVGDRDKLRIHNLYKNEIEFNDGAFGRLRAGLEELGVWDKTMVIVTADHGDEFWEHGSVGHGHSVYADQTHVPLIVYYPALIPANTVVEAGVDVLDVYPTIMDVLGKERPRDLQGKSLIPLIFKTHGDYPEPAIATQYLLHYGMQMQHWKLYLRRGEFQLYDRAHDQNEQNDVSRAHPLASRWLLDAMGWERGYRGRWDKQAFGAATNLSPDFLEKLKAVHD